MGLFSGSPSLGLVLGLMESLFTDWGEFLERIVANIFPNLGRCTQRLA